MVEVEVTVAPGAVTVGVVCVFVAGVVVAPPATGLVTLVVAPPAGVVVLPPPPVAVSTFVVVASPVSGVVVTSPCEAGRESQRDGARTNNRAELYRSWTSSRRVTGFNSDHHVVVPIAICQVTPNLSIAATESALCALPHKRSEQR